MRAGEEQPIERVDASTGRRNGDVPCAHAAQRVIPRAREGTQVIVAVRVFDVSVEVGEDVVDVNGSRGAHVVAILLIDGPQAAVRGRVAGEALGCVREGDTRERTQVGEQMCPRAGGIPQRLRIVEPELFAAPFALRGVVPVVPPSRVHNEEPRHEGVEGVFTFVSPDGVSAFPEVRVKTPFKGLEGIIAIHGGGRGELSEEDGEGTLLGFEQDSAHCGEEGLAVRSFVGISDASEVLLEVGNTRAGFEEGRVARFGVFCKDAEFGLEEVGVDGDQGGAVEQFLDGVKVVRIFAVAIQPRDDTPLLEQGVQFLCQPRGIDSAPCVPPPSRSCRSVRRSSARLRLSLSTAARSILQWRVMRRCRCSA